jgi:hypothetical protein
MIIKMVLMGCRELEKKNGVKEMGEREKRSWNAVSHHTLPSFEHLDLRDVANSYYQSKQNNGKGNDVPFGSTQLHKAHACPSSSRQSSGSSNWPSPTT